MHQNKKSVAIFTPFPQIIGGGEKYIFSLAESFSKRGFKVYLLSPFYYDISFMATQYNLKLTNCIYHKTSLKDFFLPSFSQKYDYFFTLSNHIIPPVFGKGKYNTLIIQFPFPHPYKKLGDKIQYFLQYFKLSTYQRIICYSDYSKKWIEKRKPKLFKNMPVIVVYPPIDYNSFKFHKQKENIILVVGRFFSGDHNKKHLELIKSFKKLYKNDSTWQLHIAGYLYNDEQSKKYYHLIEKEIGKYPIYLHPSLPLRNLIYLFKEAKILWHGAGYQDVDENRPEKAEHFGIVVAEAMASGTIPIAYCAGGVPEIIKNGENGFLWTTENELVAVTLGIINNAKNLSIIQNSAIKSAKKFDISNFNTIVSTLYK